MKKVSTVAAKQSRNISQQKLTIGLDLGDRNSWYCVLDEAGQIQLEQRVRTNAKALREVFGAMPRSRIALEIGTHSPWISRLLSELGHEVIVANARKVRLIGESRKKDDRLDAQTLARLARIDPELLYPVKHRSVQAQADLMTDSGACWAGAGANGAGQHGSRAGQELRGTLARMQRAQHECGESRKLESRTASRTGTAVERNRVAERAHRGIQRAHREPGAAELSAGGAAEADQGRGHADRADVPADAGRSASFPQEPRRGLLSGTATRTTETRDRANRSCTSARKAIPICERCWCKERNTFLGPFGIDCDLRRWGLKLAERGGKSGKKRAIVATARKLAVLLHHLWVSGEVYEPLHNSSRTTVAAAA